MLSLAGCDVVQEEVASPWGHDSFLLEVARYHELVAAQLERAVDAGDAVRRRAPFRIAPTAKRLRRFLLVFLK